MDFLANIVQQVLTVLYNFTESIGIPNLGLAIVLMTIIIKLIMYPLTQKQIQSTKAMMEIQPKMKALQEKYKDDKQRLNMELANLYKSEGVNPLIIQMPIMIGIFYGIRDYNYAAHPEIVTSFLWLADISKADPTYVLPVLSALTTFIQTKQTMPTNGGGAQNKMMMYFMPLFIGYISLTFPAGLVLYWVVMNIMQIAQQSIMNRAAAK